MNNNVNLSSKAWCDLVFENKNKEYGAYAIRMESSSRHVKALIIVSAMTLLAIFGSAYATKVRAEAIAKMEEEKGRVIVTEFKQDDDKPIIPVEPVKPEEPIASSVKFLPPVVAPDNEVNPEDLLKTQVELNENPNLVIASVDHVGNTNGPGKIITDVEPVVIEETVEKVYITVEQMPTFPGGDSELMAFLSKNLKYPVISAEQNVQGTVVLRFVIEKDGKVGSNIDVLRSLDPSCDKEAVRVIRSMPNWTPGKQNGAPVRVFYTIPVKFKLAAS